jgi:hypothetical protein
LEEVGQTMTEVFPQIFGAFPQNSKCCGKSGSLLSVIPLEFSVACFLENLVNYARNGIFARQLLPFLGASNLHSQRLQGHGWLPPTLFDDFADWLPHPADRRACRFGSGRHRFWSFH